MPEALKKGVGTFDYFAIGFGAIVGVGWAVSINRWMADAGGPFPASVGYLIALVLMVPVALCYCELAPMLPVAGGGVAYAYRAFGEKVAFVSGWAVLGGFAMMIPWEAIYVGDMLAGKLIPGVLGPVVYNLAGADICVGHLVLGTGLSFGLYFINRRGVATSAMFQRVMCLILISVGLLAIVVALTQFDPDNLRAATTGEFYGKVEGREVFHSGFLGGAFAILASAPFFLAGFETIPQAIEEAAGTNLKSVGKTVVLAVSMSCVFYAVLLLALGGAMPWQEFFGFSSLSGHDSFAAGHLFETVFGGPFGNVMWSLLYLGAICGLLTTWNGFFLATPLLLTGMARASLIPRSLGKLHPKYGTPTNAMIACLALSILGPFLGMGLIDPLTLFSAAGFVLSWAITSFSLVALRKKEPELKRPYRVPGGIGTGLFAGVVMTVLFVLLFIPDNPVYMGTFHVGATEGGADVPVTFLFLGWFVLGITLHLACAPQRRKVSRQERAASLFAHANADRKPKSDAELADVS